MENNNCIRYTTMIFSFPSFVDGVLVGHLMVHFTMTGQN